MIKIKFLIALTLLINICESYNTYSLTSRELCPSIRDKILNLFAEKRNIINLKLNTESSAIINERWNSSSFKKVENDCKFIIDATKYSAGIILFIEKLKLRIDKSTGECIDYLQIRLNNDLTTYKLCEPISMINAKSYIDEYGKITIKLHIDKFKPLDNLNDTLDIRIIATAYHACSKDAGNSFSCENENTAYCISKLLVNDTVHNCPSPLCLDEVSCNTNDNFKAAMDNETINTKNLVISALTSLVFTMVGVGICVYVYWKYRECVRGCCTSSTSNLHDSSRNTRRRHHREPTAPVIDMDLNEVSSTGATQIRSHNRRNHETTSKIDDKDLPPSYDSLFPAG